MSWYGGYGSDREQERLKRDLREAEYDRDEERSRNERLQRTMEREREEWRSQEQARREDAYHEREAMERESMTWDEAFTRNRSQYRRELSAETAMIERMAADPDPQWQALAKADGNFWQQCLDEIEVADRAYHEVVAEYESRRAALVQQLVSIDAEMRQTVIARFQAEVTTSRSGFVDAMENNDPGSWVDW